MTSTDRPARAQVGRCDRPLCPAPSPTTSHVASSEASLSAPDTHDEHGVGMSADVALATRFRGCRERGGPPSNRRPRRRERRKAVARAVVMEVAEAGDCADADADRKHV